MHNPLQLYTPRMLDALIKAGKKYFVRQTYKRGINHFDTEQRGSFLISYYDDWKDAKEHYDALRDEEKKFIYDISNTEHLEKLKVAVQQPSGYKVYAPQLLEEWKASEDMARKIRRYIDYKLRWKPSREEGVRTKLLLKYGELLLNLKFRGYDEEIPLSEIERL